MTTPTYNRLNKDDAIVLLVDHQTGLISLVQDFSPNEFKNNVLALADLAKFFDLPTILTTSFEQGPNGPLVPELKEMFPDAPYIARPGQINAWDNEDFVKAIKATGRKQNHHCRCRNGCLCSVPDPVGHWRKVLMCSWSLMRPAPFNTTVQQARVEPHDSGRRTDDELVLCSL